MRRSLKIFERLNFLSEMLHPLEGKFQLGDLSMPSYTSFE
jgi:hypothetical protein